MELNCFAPLEPRDGFQIALGETFNACWSYGEYEDNDNALGMVYHDERGTMDLMVNADGRVAATLTEGTVDDEVDDVDDEVDDETDDTDEPEEPVICVMCIDMPVMCDPPCVICEIVEESCEECSYA